MSKLKNGVLSASVSVACMAGQAFAGPPVPATEITQIANNFELIQSYVTQYQSLAQEIQTALNTTTQVQQGVKNLTKLPDSVWGEVQFNLTRLRQVTSNVQSLGYVAGNVDQRWKDMYPGYRPTTDFYKEYKDLSERSMNRVKQALSSADKSMDDFESLDTTVEKLRDASQSAVGQLQAVQAGNAISLAVVDQLSRMRLLMRNQLEVQENYMRLHQSTVDLRQKARENFYRVDSDKVNSESQNKKPTKIIQR